MSVRVKTFGDVQNHEQREGATEVVDSAFDQRETTVDGYTFHWGPNEVRNFLDQGIGAAHAAFKSGDDAEGIVEDNVPFGDSRS